MNILGVTLARGGSKGVPGKHLRFLGGKPVIQWTTDPAWDCQRLTDYVVSSDDAAIRAACWCDVLARPAELAQDTTPTLPALQHAVLAMEKLRDTRYDYVVELRATAPFKTLADIELVIDKLTTSGADSVIGVVEVGDGHPSRLKQLDEAGRLRDWPGAPENPSGRRQDCTPPAYLRNGSIYAFKREAVMGKAGRIFGHHFSLPYVMSAEKSVNLDTELDFLVAQVIAERLMK
jgi:CMP-N,N'-diacetyllegionaminic acid synthase